MTIHGMRHTKIYKIWESMKRRCSNPKCQRYKNYGGRGIKVCDEWHSFVGFYSWVKTSNYVEGLSPDRIDNDGDYEPANCRWVTLDEQRLNMTTSHFVTYNGEKMTISQLSELCGEPYHRVYQRITRLGWSPEKAAQAKMRGIK